MCKFDCILLTSLAEIVFLADAVPHWTIVDTMCLPTSRWFINDSVVSDAPETANFGFGVVFKIKFSLGNKFES